MGGCPSECCRVSAKTTKPLTTGYAPGSTIANVSNGLFISLVSNPFRFQFIPSGHSVLLRSILSVYDREATINLVLDEWEAPEEKYFRCALPHWDEFLLHLTLLISSFYLVFLNKFGRHCTIYSQSKESRVGALEIE